MTDYVDLDEKIDDLFTVCVDFINSDSYIPANRMMKLIKLIEAFGVYQSDEK